MISIIRNIAPGLSSSVKSVVSVSAYSLFLGSFIRNHADHFLVIHEPVVRRAFLFLLDALSVCRGLRQRLDGKKYRSVARMIFSVNLPAGPPCAFSPANGYLCGKKWKCVIRFCYFRISVGAFRLSLQPSFCLLYIFFFYFELGDSLLEHFVRLFVKKRLFCFCHAVYSLILRSILVTCALAAASEKRQEPNE